MANKYPRYDKELSLVIRQTGEKVTALFYKVNNLQLEVQELRAAVSKSNTLFLALLNDPQARHEIEAVARDLRIQAYKKE